MSGTKVMNGFGKAMVVVVGTCTMENRIREKLAEQSGPTPLQVKLERIVNGNNIPTSNNF